MNMTEAHYAQLKAALDKLNETRKTKGLIDLPSLERNYIAGQHTAKRYRWDMLMASGLRAGDSKGMNTGWPVYDYLNDEHIDTALRKYFRANGRKWACM